MVLKDKIAVITGSSTGIGSAIAKAVAKEGAKVVVSSRNDIDGGNKVVNDIKRRGGQAIYVKADISILSDVKSLFKTVKSKYGKLDILVNNAASNLLGDPLKIDVWDEVLKTNVLGAVYCTSEGIKLMDTGRILNISSIYAEDKVAWSGKSAYSASKAAINNYTRTCAKHLAPKILVNGIAPGYVLTSAWNVFSKKVIESSQKEQLIERMIKPEEIANMAVAIIKSDAMTGEVVVVDGGLSLKTV